MKNTSNTLPGLYTLSKDKTKYDLYIYVSVSKTRLMSVLYSADLLTCYTYCKKTLQYIKTKYNKRWLAKVYFKATIHANHISGNRYKDWFMYEHAPEFGREKKRASKMFIAKLKQVQQ